MDAVAAHLPANTAALARQQDEAAILGAGCDRYISKPYLIEDVEALISHYILKRRR